MTDLDFTHVSLTTLFLVYLSGIATSLTPCIYPMIPIIVAYLGGQNGTLKQRIWRAIAYIFGLSIVYACLGTAAALTGNMFGAMTTNTYVYLAFGIFILVLAGSMMDWYVIPVPSFLMPKAGGQISSVWGAFLVGASSGFVAVPCAAPVMAGLLVFISTRGNLVWGGGLMFLFSLGMNTLLLIIGISAGMASRIPRSGKWMVIIKKLLALTLLAMGLYFVYQAGHLS